MSDKIKELQKLLENRFLDKNDFLIIDNKILSKRAISDETYMKIREIIPIATTCPSWIKSKYFRNGFTLQIILKSN